LELDADGELVITDYKTGRAPSEAYEQGRLGGVHFYAFLCEQMLGRRPARVQLLHLREPLAISTVPSDQSIRGLRMQTGAIWSAIERACDQEDFRPRPGRMCGFCAYQAYCPAFGGDPALAAEAVAARRAAYEASRADAGAANEAGEPDGGAAYEASRPDAGAAYEAVLPDANIALTVKPPTPTPTQMSTQTSPQIPTPVGV
jgi:hypothetical protein